MRHRRRRIRDCDGQSELWDEDVCVVGIRKAYDDVYDITQMDTQHNGFDKWRTLMEGIGRGASRGNDGVWRG